MNIEDGFNVNGNQLNFIDRLVAVYLLQAAENHALVYDAALYAYSSLETDLSLEPDPPKRADGYSIPF